MEVSDTLAIMLLSITILSLFTLFLYNHSPSNPVNHHSNQAVRLRTPHTKTPFLQAPVLKHSHPQPFLIGVISNEYNDYYIFKHNTSYAIRHPSRPIYYDQQLQPSPNITLYPSFNTCVNVITQMPSTFDYGELLDGKEVWKTHEIT